MDLSKFDPSYAEQLQMLNSALNEAENAGAAYSYLLESAQTSFLPKKYWDIIFTIAFENDVNDEEIDGLINLADYQMFHPEGIKMLDESPCFPKKLYFNDRSQTILNFYMENDGPENSLKKNLNMLIKGLQYPHCDLDKIWANYELYSTSFPPTSLIKQYKKMKILYTKIIEADKNGNCKDWLKAVKESGHHEFICDNIEYQIAINLTEKNLWSFYLNYLKFHDINKMFHAFSNYCKIFPDDVETKQKYENAAKEYGNAVVVPWKNPFPWEIYDSNFFDKRNASTTTQEAAPVQPNDLILCRFSSKNAMPQTFPFKSSLLYYIQKQASAEILHKLVSSCKLLAIKNPFLICYKLDLSSGRRRFKGIKIHEQSMEAVGCSIPYPKKIFVSTIFKAHGVLPPFSKIIRCTAKIISLSKVQLKSVEIECLIGHGNVASFHLDKVEVVNPSNGRQMEIEDILRMVPKVADLSITGSATTPETLQKMLQVTFQNKLDEFEISFSDISHCNNEIYGQLITKNCSSKCELKILYYFSNEEFIQHREAIDESDNYIKGLIETHWNGENQKPSFSHLFCTYQHFPA